MCAVKYRQAVFDAVCRVHGIVSAGTVSCNVQAVCFCVQVVYAGVCMGCVLGCADVVGWGVQAELCGGVQAAYPVVCRQCVPSCAAGL